MRMVMAHACSPSTLEAEAEEGRSEFEANLIYRVSFRTATATQRNHVLKKKKKKKRKRKRKKEEREKEEKKKENY